MEEIKKPTKQRISKSKYDLTLSEFPIFILSKKKNRDMKYIEYEDVIVGKDKEIIKRHWKVYPDNELGFGNDSTLKTIFDLFQMWAKQNFESQYIQFGSIYNLIKQRGNATSAREYRRVVKDLNCLVGIKIEAKNAFWDNEHKAYVDMIFHLFDQVSFYKKKPTDQEMLPFARIKVSDVLYGSVLKNSILIADFDSKFFHSLAPVEQRLALYLSKIFRSQSFHKRELKEFARQIPIHAKETKHIKEQLKKSCAGLVKKGFKHLDSFDFERDSSRKSEYIIFKRKGESPFLLKKQALESQVKYRKPDYEVDVLVEDILEICQDQKSVQFYKKIARLLPKDFIYRALSEVKEIRDLGEVKKSKGAIFTSLIKKYASQQGINL
jgi:ribosomal protein L27